MSGLSQEDLQPLRGDERATAQSADGAADDALSPEMMAMLMGIGAGESDASEEGEADGEGASTLDEMFHAQFTKAISDTKEVFVSLGESDVFMADLFTEPDPRSTPEITEDDFEPEEWPIYFALRNHMRALVAKNTHSAQRMKHLRWMMMPIADSKGLQFRDACEALMSRPTVVRTRALYQLWLNEIQIEERLPPLHETLPRFLMDEIGYHPAIGHIPGVVAVAKVVWSLPGQPVDLAMAEAVKAGVEEPATAFAALEDYGYVGKTVSAGRVYFLTRNPSQMTYRVRSNFSWARALVAAD